MHFGLESETGRQSMNDVDMKKIGKKSEKRFGQGKYFEKIKQKIKKGNPNEGNTNSTEPVILNVIL